MKLPLPLKELLQRIEAKTEKTPSCWLWQGAMSGSQHRRPILSVNSQYIAVRQVLWESVNGPIPDCHRLFTYCRVPSCIKPYEGHVYSSRPNVWKYRHDQRMNNARLMAQNRDKRQFSDEEIDHIFSLRQQGYTYKQIASSIGSSDGNIGSIIRGRTYKEWINARRNTPNRKRFYALGEIQGNSKTTWQTVLVACALLKAGYQTRIVANALDLPYTTIHHIMKGETFSWITGITYGRSIVKSRGSRRYNTVVNETNVKQIVSLMNDGHRPKDISCMLKMNYHIVYDILVGRTWSWLTGINKSNRQNRNLGELHPHSALTKEIVINIRHLYSSGMKVSSIAREFSLNPRHVNKIVHRKIWAWVNEDTDSCAEERPQHPDEALVWQHWKGGQSA